MDIEETIRKAVIFTSLQDEELIQVQNITREKRFRQGELIMQEGEKGDTMYMMVHGEVEISKSLTMKFGADDFRKAEKVMTRIRPEDHVVFGEMALIGQDSRSASIIAKTDCILLEIKRDDFIELIEKAPVMGVKILLRLCELLINRFRQTSQDVIRLTTALSIALSR